jgi:hypothetical protein
MVEGNLERKQRRKVRGTCCFEASLPMGRTSNDLHDVFGELRFCMRVLFISSVHMVAALVEGKYYPPLRVRRSRRG